MISDSALADRIALQTEISRIDRMGSEPSSTASGLDRTNRLYALPVDLDKAVDPGELELSHYPGGIMISRKIGSPQRKYEIVLTNRQQSDNGKPVNHAFRETGLPVKSNIP